MRSPIIAYTVTGVLPFPVDMVRYDQAWPSSQDDADRVERSIKREIDGPVSVRINSVRAPTIGRWASFGWEVTNIDF